MRTNIASTARATTRVAIGAPPVFAIVCLAIWAAALVIVFTHQGAIDTLPFVGP